ncbi:MAG: hypothetical protein PHH11_15760 [Methylomonas sp.]|nr:hypothetical protein [Methylomonas sp.]
MSTDNTAEQLDSYYTLNLTHLKLSFWASLIALFSGLIILLCGTFLVIQGNTGLSTQLSVIGGVLTEFIGAGFFMLYGKNLKQLNVFYEKLIKHKDTLYAIGLAREVQESERTHVLQAIIGNLLSRGEPPTNPDVLKAIIESKK